MRNECSSDKEFFAQFVTPEIKKRVKSMMGLSRLRKTGGNLRKIPLSEWDSVALSLGIPRSEFRKYGTSYTLSQAVCIAKAAARAILESE